MTDLDPAGLVDQAERHWNVLGAVVAVIAWIVRVLILGPGEQHDRRRHQRYRSIRAVIRHPAQRHAGTI